jgi:hypothetical protein
MHSVSFAKKAAVPMRLDKSYHIPPTMPKRDALIKTPLLERRSRLQLSPLAIPAKSQMQKDV